MRVELRTCEIEILNEEKHDGKLVSINNGRKYMSCSFIIVMRISVAQPSFAFGQRPYVIYVQGYLLKRVRATNQQEAGELSPR